MSQIVELPSWTTEGAAGAVAETDGRTGCKTICKLFVRAIGYRRNECGWPVQVNTRVPFLNFYSMIDLPSIQGPQYLPVCTASRFDVALLARVLPML